jgi:hypothetical protein
VKIGMKNRESEKGYSFDLFGNFGGFGEERRVFLSQSTITTSFPINSPILLLGIGRTPVIVGTSCKKKKR